MKLEVKLAVHCLAHTAAPQYYSSGVYGGPQILKHPWEVRWG